MAVSLSVFFWTGFGAILFIVLMAALRFYSFRNKIRSRLEWLGEIFYLFAGVIIIVEIGLLMQVMYQEAQTRKTVQDDLDVYMKLFGVHTLKVCGE
jgi:hypothetical protein